MYSGQRNIGQEYASLTQAQNVQIRSFCTDDIKQTEGTNKHSEISDKHIPHHHETSSAVFEKRQLQNK